MSRQTPATIALSRTGVSFRLHSYVYDPAADKIGLQAAAALGVEPARVLKTLLAGVDSAPVCVLVPSDRQVSMKKLASVFAGKAAELMRPADAERLTGYHVGGISPFGQRRAIPIAMDAAALERATVFINGGQRGLQIELSPHDALRVLAARVASLTA